MGTLEKDELEQLQDPQSWDDEEDSIRPAVKSPRAVVSVAFSREDFRNIAEQAKKNGMKMSEFIRHAVLEQLSRTREPATVLSVTGTVLTAYAAVSSPRAKAEAATKPEPSAYATT